MRIGIDARELSGHPTGVGRYLSGLLREWAAGTERQSPGETGSHRFVLYAHQRLAQSFEGPHVELRVVPGAGGTVWEQTQLPRASARDRLDVFFSPGYTTPIFSRVPSVVAIHDLSFAAHPEWFTAREGTRRRFLTRRAARHARAVITISEFSRQELEQRFGVPSDRIHVIRPGIDRVSREGVPAHSADGSRRRVLYVGSIFNRRHLLHLIEAFGMLQRKHADVELDLVGDNRSFPAEDVEGAIARATTGGRARWRRYVDDETLAALYRSARAFAFLSEYEGLGLTPLEALSRGVPSVLLDTPIAHESCGGAALYVPLGDLPAIAAALERLLFDETTRKDLLAAAPAVLSRYQWLEAARTTLGVLEAAGR